MAKAPKKMAMGGDVVPLPNMSDPKYQDPAYIAAGQANADRMNTMLENARNSGVAPDYSEFDVSPMLKAGGEDINSLYGSMLGRAPDPTGIAANRGASADTIRQSILASPEYKNRMAGSLRPITPSFDDPGGPFNPQLVVKKKGGVIKKASGGGDWHGFGSSKTGKNNHGF
jgi:hypothetical protein